MYEYSSYKEPINAVNSISILNDARKDLDEVKETLKNSTGNISANFDGMDFDAARRYINNTIGKVETSMSEINLMIMKIKNKVDEFNSQIKIENNNSSYDRETSTENYYNYVQESNNDVEKESKKSVLTKGADI